MSSSCETEATGGSVKCWTSKGAGNLLILQLQGGVYELEQNEKMPLPLHITLK